MIGSSMEGDWGASLGLSDELRLTVLAVVGDEATRAFLPRVITADRLVMARDLPEGIALAEAEVPDVAFVDVGIGDGAGLAMVHHLKALVPDATVYALAGRNALEAGAHALALGGAGLFLLPLGGDELLNAVSAVRARLAERGLRAKMERESSVTARAARWIARLSGLADARDRNAAAQQVAEVFAEATQASGVAVYLVVGERATELARSAALGGLDRAPPFGSEVDILEFARNERLAVVPLALRKIAAGHVLLQGSGGAGSGRRGGRAGRAGIEDEVPSVGAEALPARAGEPTLTMPGDAAVAGGLLKLLAQQSTTVLALLTERDRANGGAAMKDPASSAYSFAYYVDVAGREIDKAKRYGRRFTIATILLEPVMPDIPAPRAVSSILAADLPVSAEIDGSWASSPELPEGWADGPAPPSGRTHSRRSAFAMDPAELADLLLDAARDTDVLARVDENEFHLLMPETAGLDAHACYRRVLARLAASDRQDGYLPRGLLVGMTTFPHDGQGLAQLLRVARRRAEATKDSAVHRISIETRSMDLLVEQLIDATRMIEHDTQPPPSLAGVVRAPSVPPHHPFSITAPRIIELALPEAVALATSVVRNALRGGAAFIAVAHHPGLSLGAAVRGALGSPREDIVLHALDVRGAPGCDEIEALCVLAEHGAYALVGRNSGGLVRGVHAADPLLADFLAERLGRAAGLRVFG